MSELFVMPQRTLYAPVEPYDTGMLRVNDLHSLYYEQSGNPSGVPVVSLHGGPGSGSNPKHRQFFDPAHYRIIVFDQRGAGLSVPHGELKENTTADLVADIERLRLHLNIGRWHVFGGSWGSTLGLAYAVAHPECVLSMTLRGVFMMRQAEINWFIYGMRTIFPEAWEAFVAPLTEEERKDVLAAYYAHLTDPDPAVHMPAAQRWSNYELACLRLIPQMIEPEDQDLAHAYAIARIECHYFVNNRFWPDDYILTHIGKIRHIPAVIVQGRYDVVCPPVSAHELSRAWPEARLVIVPDAGHSSSEPGVTDALIAATDGFRALSA